jgi:protein-tyrosine phosphatase
MAEPTPLVDLHAHILPDTDDGARNEAQALAMLRAAAEDGTTIIAATPHAHHVNPAKIAPGVERLNWLVADEGIPITVVPGAEYRIQPELAALYEQGKLVTLAGSRYALVELYLFDEWPQHLVERSLDRLLAAGARIVLAHAERYPSLQRDPALLARLAARGIPIQINANSLLGHEGHADRLAAEALLRARLGHLLASDAHHPTWRSPKLRAALERAAEIAGPEYVAWMVETAARIVRDEDVSLPEPVS